jgi:hypothetical protein
MYNSIQHFNEFGVKKIEEIVRNFVSKKKDLADLVLGLRESLFELGRNIVTEVLEDMDEYLRNCAVRKKDWEIVRKDENGLLTSFGTIRYNRTYFKPKGEGSRRYLVDEIVGIEPHDRVSADVVINAIDEAIDNSYRKAGEQASYVDKLSKQAVMNKVHQIEVCEAPLKEQEKKEVRILYIEADEDHVALQQKGKKEENKKKQSISMPKLVYVHEGIDGEKSTPKRKVLKNVRYFGGDQNTEELWLQVAQYIDKQYKEETIETIYISGDGASWIRKGLEWINKSKFVLDNYHLNKYVTAATAHLNDEAMYHAVRDALDWPDKEMLKRVFKRILELTDSESKKEAVRNARRYMLNNWDGIEIKAEKGHEIIGCSAEGHVSHVFSDRLSSRPKGWSKLGAAQMSKLRIYKKNGGKVYDLVMAQKVKEQNEKKVQVQERIIKSLRNSSIKYENILNTRITAIDKGHKTGLYKELRNIIGRCG